MKRKPLPNINLGPIPVDHVFSTVGIVIEAGDVLLKSNAQRHVQRKHPFDYDRCVPFVGMIVREPTYIGDDLRNSGKIEFIGRMPASEGLLVAVNLERDENGYYQITSFYPVSQEKIDIRRRRGFLRNVKYK